MITLSSWKIGEQKIESVQHKLQKLIDIADLIKYAEQRYEVELQYIRDFTYLFPQLAEKAKVKAESHRLAAIRLRQYFANQLNDTSL